MLNAMAGKTIIMQNMKSSIYLIEGVWFIKYWILYWMG